MKQAYTNLSEKITNIVVNALLEAMDLNDIHDKYYNTVEPGIFTQIIEADPTYNIDHPNKMGKFGKWLLNLYNTKKLKLEDLYKATDYLSTFVKYNKRIENKDINQYKTLPELYLAVKEFMENPDTATSKSDEIRRIKQGAIKAYEDDKWLIVIPETMEAAIYYGKNTQWCTAAEHSDNMFDYYNEKGDLYINIDKVRNTKYQFSFATGEFMDENDCEIIEDNDSTGLLSDLLDFTPGVVEYYKSLGYKVKYTNEDRTDIVVAAFEYAYSEFDNVLYDDYDEDNNISNDYMEDVLQSYIRENYDIDALVIDEGDGYYLFNFWNKYAMASNDSMHLANLHWYDYMSTPHLDGWCICVENNGGYFRNINTGKTLFKGADIINCRFFRDNSKYAVIVRKDHQETVVDYTTGRFVFGNDVWFDEIVNELLWKKTCSEDDDWFKVTKDGKMNLVSPSGKMLIDHWVDSIGHFGNYCNNGIRYAHVKDGRKYYKVDAKGNLHDVYC